MGEADATGDADDSPDGSVPAKGEHAGEVLDAAAAADDVEDDTEGLALARLAARVADDRKASDIVVLDVGPVLSITGWFVVASAPNTRLVRSLAEEIEAAAKAGLGRAPVRVEGQREQQWVLLDYGDVVVHLFLEDVREFYDIERLYRDVARVDWAEA